ncbi:hypothetical protein LEP1GSC059_4664 [Leptospira noguchii serovar Panama str. CZ214]|uniref:Uncharacterized protein n=1 Tax=Leptospira noguchii serovar Panama str. CZ214 TaxID=1001595 RepID=T0FM27_9LEPT|nr:hypothetical protein LEP1GSC059_4664 [Leptospira noguchii serovar Panama str. CZ214]
MRFFKYFFESVCNSSHGFYFIFLLASKFLNELTFFNVSSFMIHFSEKSWNLKLYRSIPKVWELP